MKTHTSGMPSPLRTKNRPDRVLETQRLQCLCLYSALFCTMKHFIIHVAGMNYNKKKVRQVLCRPVWGFSLQKISQSAGEMRNKGPLCETQDIKPHRLLPYPTLGAAQTISRSHRFQRMWRICFIHSMRWVCLACGLCDGEVMRSSMGEGRRQDWWENVDL